MQAKKLQLVVGKPKKARESKYSERDLDLIFSMTPTPAHARVLAKLIGNRVTPKAIQMIWIFATRPKHVFATHDLDNFNLRIRAAKKRMGWVV